MDLKGSLVVFTMCLIVRAVLCQYKDVSQLLTDLEKGYRKDVLPTRTTRSYIAVKVYPAIVRIDNLDARKEELSSTISLSLYWMDERLSWDPKHYGGVKEVYMPASSIWLPDISVHNTISVPEPFKDQLVEVSFLGNVLFVKNVHARSYCPVDLKWFPRDQHTCEVIFSSWIYTSQKMMLEFMHVNTSSTDVNVLADTDPNIINLDNHQLQLVARTASAEINRITYTCCPEESYIQLKMVMTVKRHMSLFRCLTDMYIFPMLLTTMLVPFQFLSSRKSSSRQIIGLLLVFGESLSFMALSSSIPDHSGIPSIGIVNMICVVIATLALIGSIISSKICDDNNKPLPKWLYRFIHNAKSRKNTDRSKREEFTLNNFTEIEQNGLLNGPNGVVNEQNETTEPNDTQYRITDVEMTEISSQNIENIVLQITNELRKIHSLTCENSKRKENEDWLTFAVFLDKVLFLLFLVLFIIITITVIMILVL